MNCGLSDLYLSSRPAVTVLLISGPVSGLGLAEPSTLEATFVAPTSATILHHGQAGGAFEDETVGAIREVLVHELGSLLSPHQTLDGPM